MVAVLVQLKLTLLRNSLRRSVWRTVGLIIGMAYALPSSCFVLVGMIALRWTSIDITADVTVVAYTVLTVGWLLFSLLVFGVDETVDPTKFALLPLRAREIQPGLFIVRVHRQPGGRDDPGACQTTRVGGQGLGPTPAGNIRQSGRGGLDSHACQRSAACPHATRPQPPMGKTGATKPTLLGSPTHAPARLAPHDVQPLRRHRSESNRCSLGRTAGRSAASSSAAAGHETRPWCPDEVGHRRDRRVGAGRPHNSAEPRAPSSRVGGIWVSAVLFSLVLLGVPIFVLRMASVPRCRSSAPAGTCLRERHYSWRRSVASCSSRCPAPAPRATAVAQPSMRPFVLVTTSNEPTTDHHTSSTRTSPVVGAEEPRSYRTCAAATAEFSESTGHLHHASPQRPLNSRKRSDPGRVPTSARPPIRCTATVITSAGETGSCRCSRAMFG